MMKRFHFLLWIVVCYFGLSAPARADIEVVELVSTKFQEAKEWATKKYILYTQLKKEADTYIQAGKSVKSQVTGYAKDLKDPSKIAEYATTAYITGENPFTLTLPPQLFSGMTISNKTSEDKVSTQVKELYAQTDNQSTEERSKIWTQARYLTGRNMAQLYARALILRQQLLAEETPTDEYETKADYMTAINNLVVTSAERWNKILETEAYIQEYKGYLEMQNVVQEAEETEDEK